eukprot:gene7324-14939_t
MKEGQGPIGIILSPTRELAAQIFTEAKRFAKIFNIRVCAIFGGSGKWEMIKALKESPEIVIGTPGRLIEMIRSKATNLRRCTMLVLDEADRMFEMGFEYQMRSIANTIRPDRQTLMFSATMKKKVEGFARDMLRNPIRVVVGSIGQANPDIKQVVEVFSDMSHKWSWLCSSLDEFIAEGKVLIFSGTKSDTEEVGAGLRRHFAQRQLLDQSDRASIMKKFKAGETTVLVATDVAARGLDIKNVLVVVNYDAAKNIETHVHRIGRTGRMGIEGVTPGTAYTLLTQKDSSFAVDLFKNLQLSDQHVSPGLMKLAESDPKWHHMKGGRGGGRGGGGGAGVGAGRGGLGFGPGGGPRAMTSSMLAQRTAGSGLEAAVAASSAFTGHHMNSFVSKMNSQEQQGSGGGNSASGSSSRVTSSSVSTAAAVHIVANPYVEGQSGTLGRGRHLTRPAWATDADTTSTSSLSGAVVLTSSTEPNTNTNTNIESIPISDAAPKKVSRFSRPPSQTTASLTSPPIPPSKPMAGFVRASGSLPSTLSSVKPQQEIGEPVVSAVVVHPAPPHSSSTPATDGSTIMPRKKSRWDS